MKEKNRRKRRRKRDVAYTEVLGLPMLGAETVCIIPESTVHTCWLMPNVALIMNSNGNKQINLVTTTQIIELKQSYFIAYTFIVTSKTNDLVEIWHTSSPFKFTEIEKYRIIKSKSERKSIFVVYKELRQKYGFVLRSFTVGVFSFFFF